MKVLFIGDIIGSPGRKGVASLLPGLLDNYHFDLVIANGENAAGGFGITPEVAEELFSLGINCLTSGNHIWAQKGIGDYMAGRPELLRPANYPAVAPGHGSLVTKASSGARVGVVNVMGRIFMAPVDCPFKALDREIAQVSQETNIIVVDLHAEASSEKQALGWYLDGRVSAAIGTHTHVQTSDERILPGGTAYITDVGMTGPIDSVIGLRKEDALARFLTGMPRRFEVARGPVQLQVVIIDIEEQTGKARGIERRRLDA